MVAAIDGLGHGAAAATAAGTAASIVAQSDEQDVESMMARCHDALTGTRGAAITLAWLSFVDDTMTWVALGDVEGRLLRRGEHRGRALRLPGGLAGHHPSPLTPETVDVNRGDVIVLATDGVDGIFADALELAGAAHDIAERIIDAYWDGTDDGLAIVLRWLPEGGQRAA
jgi:hypothetical protein